MGGRHRARPREAAYVGCVIKAIQDTDRTALEQLDARYARMTPADKLRRVRQLTLAANRLALAGRRMRDPDLGDAELLRGLAQQRLGRETVDRVYGAAPERDGTRSTS